MPFSFEKTTTVKVATLFIALNTVVLPFSYACAKEVSEQTVSQSQLSLIASQFLEKIKSKKEFSGPNYGIENGSIHALQGDFDQIPDGQALLLRPKIGTLLYEFDIYAVKKNRTVYFSFLDVIDILELAINFDPETKKGNGWFLREDWKINVDLNQGVVLSKEGKIDILPNDFFEQEGDIFVSQEALSQWLSMDFVSDVGQQYLEIYSPYPLPGVARNYRLQKNKRGGGYNNTAQLPRKETEYDWFDINTADVRLGTRYRKLGKSKATRLHTSSVAVQGQALKHEAYLLASGDNEENLQSVRARLSKRDENPELLGPLKARSYVLGDTDITDIPLTGDARQELGFRVSNNTLTNVDFETTDINGDAIPNWDVELYRNGVLVASQLVDDNGRYEFSDVQLFAGNNVFEIFFYGQQGEIRNRTINIPVNAALLASQDNTYDVSVSLSDTETYRKNQTDDVDRDTPHLSARYNKVIGGALGYVGVRNRNVEGENKTFVGVGATKLIANTIVDVNAGIDDKANTAAQIVARKNIKEWNLALRGLVQDENYTPNETTNPRVYEVAANAQRNFRFTPTTRSNVSVDAEYGEVASGDVLTTGRLGLSHQFGPYNISDTTFYESISPASGTDSDRLENTLSLRANMGKVFVRGGVNYDIKPESKVDEYFSQISYRPNSKFSGDLYLEHDPDERFNEARLNLNYTHKNFRTSPFIEVDSNDEIFAGVNVNFNVIDSPNDSLPIITSKQTMGRSMVSAFVYHDKNGNFVYDGEDEPLPDVTVESLNVKRRADTNEKGYSLIRNLSGVRATDIVVDDQTLPDPFMISAGQGFSIFPSPGEITELKFPVHLAGEIDGTISVRNENGDVKLAKGGEITLYSLSPQTRKEHQKITVPVAYDGFYIASKVPPGRYLMTISNETASRFKAAAPNPEFIDIGYAGDTLYGHDFELLANRKNVPINVSYELPDDFSVLSDISDILYTVKIGDKNSSFLSEMVSKIAKKRIPSRVFNGLSPLKEIGGEKEEYYMSKTNDLADLFERCEMILDYGLSCSLEVWVPDFVAEEAVTVASR
ncbi:MAG: hypothetical protein CMH31_05790 [Micavibrio sp.]|nr:hypothetical protein [Micavibrio sp.]